jgi:hypothetical protein
MASLIDLTYPATIRRVQSSCYPEQQLSWIEIAQHIHNQVVQYDKVKFNIKSESNV